MFICRYWSFIYYFGIHVVWGLSESTFPIVTASTRDIALRRIVKGLHSSICQSDGSEEAHFSPSLF